MLIAAWSLEQTITKGTAIYIRPIFCFISWRVLFAVRLACSAPRPRVRRRVVSSWRIFSYFSRIGVRLFIIASARVSLKSLYPLPKNSFSMV